MELSENAFKVLDALDSHEITTQRQLSRVAGVSLGQVNYVLKTLLEKGFVKLGNFKKNPRKIGYAYLLTPSGMEAKSTLAVQFVLSKLKEYHRLRRIITSRLSEIEKRNLQRIVFVGPGIIYDVLNSVIEERNLNLSLVAKCNNLKGLETIPAGNYDIAILGNGDPEDLKKCRRQKDQNQIAYLW
ncbi:MAG: MarR family EPS-associated transcriptional regulator [Promethearchaeota archaeon]